MVKIVDMTDALKQVREYTEIQEKRQEGFAVRCLDPKNGKRFVVPLKTKKEADDKAAQLKWYGMKDVTITKEELKAEELKEVKYTIGYEIDSDDRNDKKYKGEDEMSVNASSSRDAAKKFGQEMNKLVKKAGQRSKSILKIGMTSFEDNNRDYNASEINKLDDYANDFIYKGIYDSYLIKAEDLNEKIEYAYLRFRNKNEANRAAKTAAELAGHHTQMPGKHIEIEVSSGGAGENLTIDGGKNDVSKIVKELVRLYRPKVLEKESLDKSVKEKMGANTPSNPNRYKQYLKRTGQKLSNELTPKQKMLDKDKDGDIGGDDLAKVRATKKETENKKYLQTKPGSLEEAILKSRGLIK